MEKLWKQNRRQILMTIEHLNRFHLRAVRKETKMSDIPLDNVFSKLMLVLWVSLLEVEFNILISENKAITDKFCDEMNINKKSLTEKWLLLLDFYFKDKFLKNHKRLLNISSLGHTDFHRYKTLKDIIGSDLNLFIELRNKIAHGQWAVAFNDGLLQKNQTLTTHIWKLTKKEMMLIKSLHKNLVPILKLLIISKKTFQRDYDKYVNRIIKAKEDADLKYQWIKNKTK